MRCYRLGKGKIRQTGLGIVESLESYRVGHVR